ncbi:MAG: LodA/GoxA family CTQ-dependent oxidase [Chitinophagaceae bacterium]
MNGKISSMAIYPPVGVVRVGNSNEFFLASEIPGQPAIAKGGYKDNLGRVKKQAVCFHVYALDENGNVLKEITADDADITWRIHVANHKAGWYQFMNALDLPGLAIPAPFRNGAVNGADRQKLIIDPGPRTISGKNISGPDYYFTGGKFYDKPVPLGEARTDEHGRLIVLGGDGKSASYNNSPAITFANNDGWHDDVSDGTVRASITLDGQTFEAEPAMVVVTPPNFGQGLYAVVTMYDVVSDLFIRSGWMKGPDKVIFYEHIYPILERTVQTQWVNQGFYILFGQNSPSDFTAGELLKQLSDPSKASQELRYKVFAWYRKPEGELYEPAKIPPFYGDAFGDYEALPNVDLPLTATQYEWMQQWADGNFETGTKPTPVSFESLNPQQQTESLNRAPLEECLGGPFHPGIEITWPFRNLIFWEKAFRIKTLPEDEIPAVDYGPLLSPAIALAPGGPLDGSGPGSLSRWMGVPWQTDEASCLSGYDPSLYLTIPSFWAARVPNQILTEDSFKRLSDSNMNDAQRLKHLDYRQDWLRDLGTQYQAKINAMVKRWHELGIIVQHPLPPVGTTKWLPEQLWVESDRGPFAVDDPTFKQVLIAENAEPKVVKEAAILLDEVAGRVKAPARPKRARRSFRRDEM